MRAAGPKHSGLVHSYGRCTTTTCLLHALRTGAEPAQSSYTRRPPDSHTHATPAAAVARRHGCRPQLLTGAAGRQPVCPPPAAAHTASFRGPPPAASRLIDGAAAGRGRSFRQEIGATSIRT
jgi:hypothetical protein